MLGLCDGGHDACVEVTGKVWSISTLLLPCEFRGWTLGHPLSGGRTEITELCGRKPVKCEALTQVCTLWFVGAIDFAFWVSMLSEEAVLEQSCLAGPWLRPQEFLLALVLPDFAVAEPLECSSLVTWRPPVLPFSKTESIEQTLPFPERKSRARGWPCPSCLHPDEPCLCLCGQPRLRDCRPALPRLAMSAAPIPLYLLFFSDLLIGFIQSPTPARASTPHSRFSLQPQAGLKPTV